MLKNLSSPQQKFIKIFVASILLLYFLIAILSTVIISNDHEKNLPTAQLQLYTKSESAANEKGRPLKINTGIYLDSIENASIKDSYWTATFYIWFRWEGDKSLDPGKSFQLVDAKIDKKELQDSYTSPDGVHYQCYRVVAKMTKFFNTQLLPLESHTLNIFIEDAALDDSKLQYVADSASNISPDVKVPGFAIKNFGQQSGAHTYKTTYGDPRIKEGDFTSYSQYNFALHIKRIGFGFYLKLFVGMFAGVLLTLGSFFIRPADTGPRYGIPSAAYFGAVGNTYMVNSIMPPSGGFGLTDLVTGVGLLTITICVGATLMSGYFYLRKDEKDFSKAIDTVAWSTIGAGYIVVNIMLPILAFY